MIGVSHNGKARFEGLLSAQSCRLGKWRSNWIGVCPLMSVDEAILVSAVTVARLGAGAVRKSGLAAWLGRRRLRNTMSISRLKLFKELKWLV